MTMSVVNVHNVAKSLYLLSFKGKRMTVRPPECHEMSWDLVNNVFHNVSLRMF